MRLEAWQRGLVAALAGGPAGDGADWPIGALAIHRDNVAGARVQALGNVFPVLRQVLGPPCFDALAHDYVHAVPSRCADLNRCGQGFPGWLRRERKRHVALGELPYLADLARLERAVDAAFHAGDDPPTDAASLAQAARQPQAWRLRPSRSLQLLASPWPVDAIWRAHRDDDDTAGIAAGRCRAAVWRRAAHVQVATLDHATWRCLRAVVCWQPLDRVPGLDAELLTRAVREGWVTGATPRRAR